ncbi:MAG TPA: tRNA 2-thiouridine(34) synthase MnmA [Rhodanobacteraceae bacterium]|nr:tRNA 2-thiouridine(34) synthase MnmA [Rhodanobacteraceae bacterium]
MNPGPLPAGRGGHVVVGLSGGVDSTVSAWRLQQAGYHVSALFMVNWTEDEAGYCTSAEDYQSARAVCEELGITLHRVDFSAEYRREVFDHFLADYAAGKTPNPDVLCNRAVKFGPFIDYARRLGAEFVATGHYARIAQRADGPHLLRAVDANKDQTYFLATVDRARFANVLFPIGDLTKPEVREVARRAGLPNHARPDSTGICFIGERQLQPFLARYLTANPGPIVATDGILLGEHRGLASYTLGQRRGLAIGGRRDAREAPWYVVGKDKARNALIVSQDHDDPRLMCRRLTTTAFHWIQPAPAAAVTVLARIRHRQPLQRAIADPQPDGSVLVDFASPQRAAAVGQYVVLYDGQDCLGGGEIATVTQDSAD